MSKFLFFAVALCAVVGCGSSSSQKVLTPEETASQAKSDLNAKLDKADLPPQVKAQANAQLEQEMAATAARRGKPVPSGQ